MQVNNELRIISKKLKEIFDYAYKKLKVSTLTDRTLDSQVLKLLKNLEIKKEKLEIRFSEPIDSIYRVKGGRTPYDLLCSGIVNGKKFIIFINNKLGDLQSNARNDVTTYNNLLRLYMGISKQRLTSKITIDGKLIYNRVSGAEIVSYAIFVVDKEKRGSKFFLLEEIIDSFYVNPRNTMFQIKYDPSLGEPIDYYSFCITLIDSILEALSKSLNATKTEIIVLGKIKEEIIRIKMDIEDEQ